MWHSPAQAVTTWDASSKLGVNSGTLPKADREHNDMTPSPFRKHNLLYILLTLMLSGGLVWIAGCKTPESPSLTPFELSALVDLNNPRLGTLSYQEDIQPIFNARCASCHSCFDAPAQLKLTSAEGLERGASKQRVYDLGRLRQEMPTRLGQDAVNEQQWREKGFFTVLPGPEASTAKERLDDSVLYQMLAMSRLRKLPEGGLLDAIVRDSHDIPMAPTIAEFPDYIQEFPHAGMPFYTYGLTEEEFETVALWIADGAKFDKKDLSFSEEEQVEVTEWEALLNAPEIKDQLISRYLYEHLFSAHIHFRNLPDSEFFKIVRSSSPPGEPVEAIHTRRPNDDPGIARVYYRFVKHGAEIMRKNHLPYELSNDRMDDWKELFWHADWQAETLPEYSLHFSQRPFDVFQDIPENSRYRFMLDSSFYFVQAFMRGPVCRGQVALNGIWDHFFVYFFDPEADPSVTNAAFMEEARANLLLPSGLLGKKDTAGYRKVMKRIHDFQKLQNQALLDQSETEGGIGLEDIWTGESSDDTPYLTVFRHFDTASVEKGFVGETPPNGWYMDYTLLERIYYLLVVNYDVFGSVTHQLTTRLYFDYLRYEGECNYLRLFPEEGREEMFSSWYDGVSKTIKLLNYPATHIDSSNNITYQGDTDVRDQLRTLLEGNSGDFEEGNSLQYFKESYTELPQETAPFVQYFPEVIFVRIREDNGENTVLTILRNKAFKNVSGLLNESERREPESDNLLFVEGLIGDYPNMMMDLSIAELEAFSQQISQADSFDKTLKIWLSFGVQRTSSEFWPTLDWFTDWQKKQDPIQAGRFDLKHYYLTKLLALAEADLVE